MLLRHLLIGVFALTFSTLSISTASLAQQRESALVGQWHAKFQTPQGGGDIYVEYLSDGRFRSIIYTPTQGMTIAQDFGTYTARPEASGQLRVHRSIARHLPTQLCFPNGGNCQPIPPGGTETEGQFTVQGDGSLLDNSNMTFRRESIPPQFLQTIPDRIFLHQVPVSAAPPAGGAMRPSSSNSTAPAPAHMTPRIAPGNSDTCNDLQQNRLCTVNGGTMYTDKRGCRMCASP
jgi:hypothetical protein